MSDKTVIYMHITISNSDIHWQKQNLKIRNRGKDTNYFIVKYANPIRQQNIGSVGHSMIYIRYEWYLWGKFRAR